MKAITPSEPGKETTNSAPEPETTAPSGMQIYAKGLRSPGKLSELQGALAAIPGLRFRVDAPHDVIFFESDSPGLSPEAVSRIFDRIGLQARFVANRTRRATRLRPSGGNDQPAPAYPSEVSEAPPRGFPASVGLPDPEELPLYVRNVATLRGLGFSFPQIARHYGVTPQAISVLLTRQRASVKQGKALPELAGLSPRAANCLGRLRIGTRAEARKRPNLPEELQGQRNCGQKTVEEILRWRQNAGPDQSRGSRKGRSKKLRLPIPKASIQPV